MQKIYESEYCDVSYPEEKNSFLLKGAELFASFFLRFVFGAVMDIHLNTRENRR